MDIQITKKEGNVSTLTIDDWTCDGGPIICDMKDYDLARKLQEPSNQYTNGLGSTFSITKDEFIHIDFKHEVNGEVITEIKIKLDNDENLMNDKS